MLEDSYHSPESNQVRDIEMQLFREIGAQLKGVVDALKDMTLEMRDVRERLIRIEAQDQPVRIKNLEDELGEVRDEVARLDREYLNALSEAATKSLKETNRIEKESVEAVGKLEKRLLRMESVLAPITMGGSAFLAAVMSILATYLFSHGAHAG